MDIDRRSITLAGELTTDPEALADAATDFGHLVEARPRAVLRPGSTDDIAAVLRRATQHAMPVVARGCGHSAHGQAQTRDGIVIDLTQLAEVHDIGDDHVTVDAGATWASVLRATLPHGLTPPVLTDYLQLSVGGTVSVGGLGGTTRRYGAQTDTVVALDAVTADGHQHHCSPTTEPDLFHALLAGLGRCGIITRATLRLVPAPERVRRYKLYYPTAHQLLERQRQLLREGRFDHLQGQIIPSEQGWEYILEGATYYTPPGQPDDEATLEGLEPGRDKIEDLTYWDFADRLDDTEVYLRETGEWWHPHPWANLLLPDATTDDFLTGVMTGLTHADLGAPGLLLVYPFPTRTLTTPLLRVPDHPVVFLVAALRYAPPNDVEAVQRMIATNRNWYERARDLGGTAYPASTIPFAPHDWIHHYGPAWPGLETAKKRFDPANILGTSLDSPG